MPKLPPPAVDPAESDEDDVQITFVNIVKSKSKGLPVKAEPGESRPPPTPLQNSLKRIHASVRRPWQVLRDVLINDLTAMNGEVSMDVKLSEVSVWFPGVYLCLSLFIQHYPTFSLGVCPRVKDQNQHKSPRSF